MATATATATKAPAQNASNGKQSAPMPVRPFITGTHEIETHTYDKTVTMATSTQTLEVYDLVTDGYVAGLYILVDASVTGNTTAATATFQANAPWNVLGTVQFSDVSNRPIIGPMSGWELKQCVKYGGYSFSDDPQDSQTYSVTTGTTASGGSFSFVLRLPIEFVHRNALGSLTNLSNAAVFRLEMTMAASTSVYAGTTGTPITLPSVRFRVQQFGWMESAGHDTRQRPAAPTPLAVDTIQYLERQTYTITAGSQNFRFTPFEGWVRGVYFVLTDSNQSRSVGETDWPDPLRLHYDAVVPIDKLKTVWKRQIEENWGYKATIETAGGKENGFYPLSWARDFGLKVGAEQAFGYLPVSSGTTIRFDGSIGGSGTHTLTVLWNYLNPAGGNDLALTGGR